MSIKSFIKRLTKKMKCVYWAPLGLDSDGHMEFDEPIELRCRWSDMNTLFINAKGEEAVSRCMVIMNNEDVEAKVPDDIQLGGMLWLGELEDLEDQDEPQKNDGSNIIQAYNKVPDIKVKTFVRTAIC